MPHALVIGAGPAGLMAAQELARAGLEVTLCDAKPSFGRKFLMAGKSGLNLTKAVPTPDLVQAYGSAAEDLRPMLEAFDAQAVQAWAQGLGQELFIGSTGRVFPKAMKASPLLRAWLGRLDELGVTRRTGWRWTGWADRAARFATPHGFELITADVTVLALGGASWARLGSDGAWSKWIEAPLAPFQPSNVGLKCRWSPHMKPFFGTPIKAVAWQAGDVKSQGEAVITASGLEGGGIYTLSPALRQGAALTVDLRPKWTLAEVAERLSRASAKSSISGVLRKTLGLGKTHQALLNECAHPLPRSPETLAALIKALPITAFELGPMDGAISTAGGVRFEAMTPDLMLRTRAGVFCAGEMLDWDAPTGGYLLNGCFATGSWAGRAAARYAKTTPAETNREKL